MKILFHADSPTVNTGFGIVSKNIVDRLYKRGYNVTVLGINYYGEYPIDPREYPYPIYSCEKGPPDAVFGTHKLWAIAQEFKPDLLFFLNDPWVIDRILAAKNVETPYLKTIGYFPIDGGPLKESWAKTLNTLDAQVCYSHFAEKVVIEANKKVRPDNLYQIYHGVDQKTFFPINQNLARMQLNLPTDAFIVGMVARNQYRKRFDILAKAFTEFAKDKPDAKLYLHTSVKDIGYDIKDMSEQLGLGSKLILTENMNPAHGVPADFLNLIYNSFDVNCLISLGDGFGLPVAESMSTGCPQLVSDHSCLKELVEDHGGLTVKNAAWIMNTNGINTWGGISDEEDLVEKLNILYNSQTLRIKLAEDGFNYITQPDFDWDVIVDKFEDIIGEVFHLVK